MSSRVLIFILKNLNKTNSMRISGISGKWEVTYQIGLEHIHINYSNGEKKGIESCFTEITDRLTYESFRESVESAIWELEKGIIDDRTWRVKVWCRDLINELEPKWINGCKLIEVPKPSEDSKHFVFNSPDGQKIIKLGLGEFELEGLEE